MTPLADAATGATGLACGFFQFRGALATLVVDSLPDYLVLRAGEPALRAVGALFGLAYSELTAAIIVIGVLGYALDWLARAAHARWLHAAPARDLG